MPTVIITITVALIHHSQDAPLYSTMVLTTTVASTEALPKHLAPSLSYASCGAYDPKWLLYWCHTTCPSAEPLVTVPVRLVSGVRHLRTPEHVNWTNSICPIIRQKLADRKAKVVASTRYAFAPRAEVAEYSLWE